MSKKCKVVLIDTGIDLKNKLLSKIHIEGVRIKKDKSGYVVERDKENPEVINDNIGYGTAVSGIILSHNPEVEFFIVKIFDWNTLNADTELLCYALEYIINNVEFDIINMSLGVCVVSNQNKLYSLCNQIKEKNKVIVSAFDNNGSISYPAAYDCVVGVTSGEECRKINDIISIENEMVNYCAKGGYKEYYWLGCV